MYATVATAETNTKTALDRVRSTQAYHISQAVGAITSSGQTTPV